MFNRGEIDRDELNELKENLSEMRGALNDLYETWPGNYDYDELQKELSDYYSFLADYDLFDPDDKDDDIFYH